MQQRHEFVIREDHDSQIGTLEGHRFEVDQERRYGQTRRRSQIDYRRAAFHAYHVQDVFEIGDRARALDRIGDPVIVRIVTRELQRKVAAGCIAGRIRELRVGRGEEPASAIADIFTGVKRTDDLAESEGRLA